MKNRLLVLVTAIVLAGHSFGQALITVKEPLDNSTTQVRAPNGLSTYAYLRACSLVLGSELTSIAPGTTLTAFGFTLDPVSTVSAPTAGNFTVYLQNTSDASYNKGTTFATAIASMTTVFTGTMTLVPYSTSSFILLTLSTPFVYTGGGLYVAYDWYSAGPYSTTPITYRANSTGLSPGTASGNSSSSAPTTLGTTAFRPSFLFGYANPYNNDIQVMSIDANGKIAGMLNQSQVVNATLRNSGGVAQNNIVASLNVGGANAFSNTQTITSLAAGASTVLSFAGYTPSIAGLNTVSVSVPSDQNNANNSVVVSQSVTCNQYALNPPGATYSAGVGFGTGSGMIVTSYSSSATATLNGLWGAVSSDAATPGNTSWGVVLNSSGAIIATTNTITLTAGMLSTFQSYTFATPPVLNSGSTYYYGFAQPANASIAYYPAGTFQGLFFPQVYYTASITGGAFTPLANSYGYFGIEAVFAPVSPTVSIASATVTCGSAATLVATTSASYTWTSGTANANLVVAPILSSTYTVNIMDALGCTGSQTAAVTVNSLVLTINSPTICSGNSATIVPGGAGIGGTYTISGGLYTVSPASTSFYSVTGTATNGCVSSAVISTVSVKATPSIAVNNPVLCSGASVAITPTAAGITSFGITGGSFTVAPGSTTSYSVTGTGTNGCVSSNTAVATVSVNTTPTISVNSVTICSGKVATLTPTGAGTGGTYTVTGNSFTLSPAANAAYSVTGTSTAGCVSAAAVANVSVNASPVISVNNATVCQGNTVAIVPGGASGGTYTITGNSFTVTPLSNTSYSVTGTAANGCAGSNTAVASIFVNTMPTITVNSATICSGASVSITPAGAAGGTYTVTGNSFTVAPLTTTNYSVTGTSTNGCVSQNTAVATVSVNTTPTITVNNSVICSGNTAIILPAGAGSYTITGNTFTVNPTTTTNYSVTGTGTNGCLANNTAVATVSVNPNPVVAVNNGTVCSGSPIVITPTGASSYSITGGSFTVSPTSTSSYSVSGIDVNGCTSPQVVSTITVIALPAVTAATLEAIICSGETTSLNAGGAISYTWSTTETASVIAISPTVTTTYTVTGTDIHGCMNSAVITQLADACTGIKLNSNKTEFTLNVYPNPSNGQFAVETAENAHILVMNAIGQIVFNTKATGTTSIISIEQLPGGIYFVKAITGQDQNVVKIIKE